MATENEAAFPIRDFQGVDRQANSEDIQKNAFLQARNMWERELGSLETRFGSLLKQDTFSSNVEQLLDIHKLTTKNATRRIVTMECTPDVSRDTSLPANVSMTFSASAQGNWLRDLGPELVTEPLSLIFRAVGYGVDKSYSVSPTTLPGYGFPLQSQLNVTVSTAFDSNVTGFEIYAVVGCHSGSVRTRTLWVGFQDLTTTPTGTWTFLTGPKSRKSSYAGVLFSNGDTGLSNLMVTQSASSGSFSKGQEVFVLVLPQRIVVGNITSGGSDFHYPAGDPFDDATLLPVVIEEDNTGLFVDWTTNEENVCIFVGESYQTMIPVKTASNIERVAGGGILIQDFPKNRPGVANVIWSSSGVAEWNFRLSDYSVEDTLIRVADDGSYEPLFCSRIAYPVNDPDFTNDFDPSGEWIGSGGNRGFIVNSELNYPKMGAGDRYNFVNNSGLCFFVNTHNIVEVDNIQVVTPSTNHDYKHNTKQNYYVTDGMACAPAIMDNQGARSNRSWLPPVTQIVVFEDAIVVGGGSRIYDEEYQRVEDASTSFIFSVVTPTGTNPYNFRVDAADTTVLNPALNSVNVEAFGEKISGIGIYTNSTADDAASSRLFITKKNSFYTIADLPDVSAGVEPLDQISGAAGCVNGRTIVNTTIGTIMASVDNIYLLRGTGEPIPIADQISDILRRSDMTNAFARFHDEQYKISFYDPEEGPNPAYNNVEWWLDINRMKATKGQPSWKGPMTGRNVDSQVVENRDVEGLSYDSARDRWALDNRRKLIYVADVLPNPTDSRVFDFNKPVVSRLETKDFVFSQQFADWNKLYTRMYYKIRSNKKVRFQDSTFIDGVQTEDVVRDISGSSGIFDNKPFIVFPIFPSTRMRGRTIRKIFETKDRVSIGGLNVHFKTERRRI